MRRKLTVRKLVSRFLEWATQALSPSTVEAYSWQLERFIAATGDRPVCNLKPAHFTAWARTWHQWQAVIRLLNWAVSEARILKVNPYAHIKAPPRNERQRILSPAEMVRILRRANPAARAYLLALRETYARPQEIRAACWDDLCSEDPAIPLADALVQGKALIVLREFKDRKRRKEKLQPRILLVSSRLGRTLLRLMARRTTKNGKIFVNRRSRPWTNNAVRLLFQRLRRWLQIMPDKYGETVVAYTFRHSVATLASARGIKDRLLADLLGHVETRTTRRYQHLDVGHIRDALARLAADRAAARKKAI